jgi:hypothetical protein
MLSKPSGVSAAMRIDLEQFLAYTMILGTAGAIGAAVYTTTMADDETAAVIDQPAADLEIEDAEPEPVTASNEPVIPPVPPAPASPPPIEPDPDFHAEPDPAKVPAPTFEGMW